MQAEASPAPTSSGSWPCAVCTFINAPLTVACAMCGASTRDHSEDEIFEDDMMMAKALGLSLMAPTLPMAAPMVPTLPMAPAAPMAPFVSQSMPPFKPPPLPMLSRGPSDLDSAGPLTVSRSDSEFARELHYSEIAGLAQIDAVLARDMHHVESEEVKNRAARFTCVVCTCEEQIDGAFSAECVARGSRHFTCFECIVQHCRVKINAMSDDSEDRVTCAFPGCDAELTPAEVEGLGELRIGSAGNSFCLEKECCEKYSNLLMMQWSRRQPGFQCCPRNCGFGLELGPADFLRCGRCKDEAGLPITFCLKAGCGEAHDPRKMPCAEFRRQRNERVDGTEDAMRRLETFGADEADAGLELLRQRPDIQVCPGCRHAIEKDPNSCDKFQCRCGMRFCWKCGQRADSRGLYSCGCTGHNHVAWDNLRDAPASRTSS